MSPLNQFGTRPGLATVALSSFPQLPGVESMIWPRLPFFPHSDSTLAACGLFDFCLVGSVAAAIGCRRKLLPRRLWSLPNLLHATVFRRASAKPKWRCVYGTCRATIVSMTALLLSTARLVRNRIARLRQSQSQLSGELPGSRERGDATRLTYSIA